MVSGRRLEHEGLPADRGSEKWRLGMAKLKNSPPPRLSLGVGMLYKVSEKVSEWGKVKDASAYVVNLYS